MITESWSEKMKLKELVDAFANLADEKNAAGQGELFTEQGVLEFQVGFDGELQKIEGKEMLVKAFSAALTPCKSLFHINGQHCVTISENGSEAEGILYSQAMLVNETEGKDVLTSNSIRYKDHYVKIGGKWYISSRRSTFLISEKRILDS